MDSTDRYTRKNEKYNLKQAVKVALPAFLLGVIVGFFLAALLVAG